MLKKLRSPEYEAEREKERGREREGEIVKDLKLRSPLRECMVCVCVCVSERERYTVMSLSGRPGSQGLTHLMSYLTVSFQAYHECLNNSQLISLSLS